VTGAPSAAADPTAGIERRPRPQTSKVVTIGAAHAAHDTYSAFLPPMLPVLVEKLALAKAEAGLLTVFLQAPSILQPWIGHLGDRLDLRAAVILSPAVTAIAMSLLGVAPGFATVALLLVIAGASSAVLHSVGPVLAGRLSGPRLGWGMGFWMVGGELGRTLGPILLVSAVALLGVRGLPWLMVGGLAASAVLAVSLRGLAPQQPASARPEGFVRAFRSMGPLLVPLSGVVISRSFMMAAATIYLPLFLREEGSSLWLAGASLSILEAAGVVGALLGGSASDVLGRRRVLAASILAAPPLLVGAGAGWRLGAGAPPAGAGPVRAHGDAGGDGGGAGVLPREPGAGQRRLHGPELRGPLHRGCAGRRARRPVRHAPGVFGVRGAVAARPALRPPAARGRARELTPVSPRARAGAGFAAGRGRRLPTVWSPRP
jgi:MFS transporter, FSR family, fosmidomycin resistance protein